MRKLYLLRGLPASGKSTFIKENHLEDYTISSDKIRQMFCTAYDEWSFKEHRVFKEISQKNDKDVFATINRMLNIRFEMESTTILDATNINIKSLNNFYKLAKSYNYRVYVVDFMNNISIDEIKRRNRNREFMVPESVIDRMYSRYREIESGDGLPNKFIVISPDEMIKSFVWNEFDANEYNKIRVIGDIHNSGTPLEKLVSNFDENTLYVFTGDYFDRGVEPAKTMDILNKLIDKKNIIFLEGNHEIHIRNYIIGNKSKVGRTFINKTLPKLIEANGEDKVKSFLKKLLHRLQDVSLIRFNGKLLVLTHAGLTNDQLDFNKYGLHNSHYFVKGLGKYELDIDKIFEEKVDDKDIYQIHGHRNNFLHDVTEFTHSFNLEQKVEYGNKLGAVDVLKTNDGIKIVEVSEANKVIKNETKWDKYSEVINQNEYMHSKYLINKHIKGKGNITMYHFSRDAFKKNAWNLATMSARGLYIDDTNHVIARGFNKFFVMDQREGYMREEVVNKMINSDKVIFSNKLDGFLGIVAYSPSDDSLLITSKTNGETYSEFAKELLSLALKKNNHTIEELTGFMKKDYLNGKRYSLTFEMINEEFDPHLVAYNNKNAVLLEVIPNSINKNSLISKNMQLNDAINKRKEISEKFGLDVPEEKEFVINNKEEANKLINGVINSKDKYEGVVANVINGNNEFKFKLKTEYFMRMKLFRTVLEKAVSILNNKNISKANNSGEILTKIIDNYIIKLNDVIAQNEDINERNELVINKIIEILNALKKEIKSGNDDINKLLVFSKAEKPIKKIDIMKTLDKYNLSLV